MPNMVHMVGAGSFGKLLEVINELLHLMFEVALTSDNELLVGVIDLLVIASLVTAGSDFNSLGSPLCLLLSLLALLFMPLSSALRGTPRPPLGAAFLSPWMKIARTASSLEACQVAMSRSFFVVFSGLRPSSCTRVRQFILDQNAEMASAS
jgi:hypothetical protein